VRLAHVRDPQSKEHFAIEACPACGVGHTTPEPEDLSGYYGQSYYGGRHGFTAQYRAARRLRLLSKATEHRGQLLDIGCGDGTFLLAARAQGWNVTGTELGGTAELSRRTGLVVRDSLEQLADLPPFDAITLWHSLEHFRDPGATLAAVRRRLAPGGTLIVAVPDAAGLQARLFKRHWFHLDVPRHLYHFDRDSLTTLLQSSGFALAHLHHLELELDLFGWIQSALNTVIPQPNVLFQSLTGKGTRWPGQLAASVALATVLGPAALGAMALGTLTGRGATLIAVARPGDGRTIAP